MNILIDWNNELLINCLKVGRFTLSMRYYPHFPQPDTSGAEIRGRLRPHGVKTARNVPQIDWAPAVRRAVVRLGRPAQSSIKGYGCLCCMYLWCPPAAAGPALGCCRQTLAQAGCGLPGWTAEVHPANPQPLLPRRPASPALSLASAALRQNRCLAGADKQEEKHAQTPLTGVHARRKHWNITQSWEDYFSLETQNIRVWSQKLTIIK